jgi:hypothetical protein
VPGHADSITTIWVHFDDPKVGEKTRQGCKHKLPDGIHTEWTPVRRVDGEFSVTVGNVTGRVHRSQFPLQLANARSTGRSQGVTEHNGGVVSYTHRLLPFPHPLPVHYFTEVHSHPQRGWQPGSVHPG